MPAGFRAFPQVLINVRVRDKKLAVNDEDVVAEIQRVADILGNSGRILLRQSGTEPVIRVMVEANNEELCRKLAQDVADIVEMKYGSGN